MDWIDRFVTLACRFKRGGVILNYHTPTAAQMREQIELWAPYFDFIHHDELGKRLEHRGKKPFCLITYDDGKKSNLTEVAPVLKTYGVPGVFYVVTKFVGGELPVLWFDTYHQFVKHIGRRPQALDPVALKRLPHAERLALLEKTYEAHGFRFEHRDADTTPMSWDEVRQLHAQGHTIGAHSETHPILTTIPAAEAKSEIERSITTVSEKLGAPCSSFAFPNGNYTEELARHALHCGARTVMTTEPMWMRRAEQPWRVPRVQIHFERDTRQHRFKMFVASLGWVLKNPDDTGRQYLWSRLRHPHGTATAASWSIENSNGRRQRQAGAPSALDSVGSD
jgi:peptidoglycan/xylan/chitin deacetylase (PgdA/CDA1 family)